MPACSDTVSHTEQPKHLWFLTFIWWLPSYSNTKQSWLCEWPLNWLFLRYETCYQTSHAACHVSPKKKMTTISGSHCKQQFQRRPACECSLKQPPLACMRLFMHALTYFLSHYLFVPPPFSLVGRGNDRGNRKVKWLCSLLSSSPPFVQMCKWGGAERSAASRERRRKTVAYKWACKSE